MSVQKSEQAFAMRADKLVLGMRAMGAVQRRGWPTVNVERFFKKSLYGAKPGCFSITVNLAVDNRWKKWWEAYFGTEGHIIVLNNIIKVLCNPRVPSSSPQRGEKLNFWQKVEKYVSYQK